MEIIGGGLPENCKRDGRCRGCPDIGALNIGCSHDDSGFWVGQRVQSVQKDIATFGRLETLLWLIRNLDAAEALDLWERATGGLSG